jgi:hypothetical protein
MHFLDTMVEPALWFAADWSLFWAVFSSHLAFFLPLLDNWGPVWPGRSRLILIAMRGHLPPAGSKTYSPFSGGKP